MVGMLYHVNEEEDHERTRSDALPLPLHNSTREETTQGAEGGSNERNRWLDPRGARLANGFVRMGAKHRTQTCVPVLNLRREVAAIPWRAGCTGNLRTPHAASIEDR